MDKVLDVIRFPGQNLGIIFDHFWGLLPIIGVPGSSFVIVLFFAYSLKD